MKKGIYILICIIVLPIMILIAVTSIQTSMRIKELKSYAAIYYDNNKDSLHNSIQSQGGYVEIYRKHPYYVCLFYTENFEYDKATTRGIYYEKIDENWYAEIQKVPIT